MVHKNINNIKNKKINKGLTLVETFVSIIIISLLITIIVQIIFIFSNLNKRATYLSDSDIKAKELGLKIEKAIYQLKNSPNFVYQFIYVTREAVQSNGLASDKTADAIYTIYQGQMKTIARLFIKPILLNKKYYRKAIIYYRKKNIELYNTNIFYLPEEIFWKIEEVLYKNNNVWTKGNYVIYNPVVNNLNESYFIYPNSRFNYKLQRFRIYFYFYSVDIHNRPYSRYKQDRDFLINEYLKKYQIKKSYFIIFDYLY